MVCISDHSSCIQLSEIPLVSILFLSVIYYSVQYTQHCSSTVHQSTAPITTDGRVSQKTSVPATTEKPTAGATEVTEDFPSSFNIGVTLGLVVSVTCIATAIVLRRWVVKLSPSPYLTCKAKPSRANNISELVSSLFLVIS